MSKVVVIGGGVIGLATAWELQQRGADVIVLDARTAGMAASAANAGYIVTSNPGPVPIPGLVKTSLKWMLNPESPLYIRPRADARFMAWLYRFWRACNALAYAAGLESSAEFLRETPNIIRKWCESGLDCEIQERGRMIAYQDEHVMEAGLAGYVGAEAYGFAMPEALYGDHLHDFEPALSEKITAAFYIKDELTVEPISLVKGLIGKLQGTGVEIRHGSPVVDLVTGSGRVTAVRTPSEVFEADHVLISAGAWSGEVGKLAGVRLPIEGGKGYALDFRGATGKPQRSISLRDAKIAVTPFDDGLRLSGTMELAGLSDSLTRRRINAIHRGGREFLNNVPEEPTHIRSGLRPMAPDGLPVLGSIEGYRNLTVATGHSMLGVTMAAVTATNMAELITTGETPDVIKPFTPSRFKGLF